MMKTHLWLAVALSLLCTLIRPAAAETVVEAWRSPFGMARSVSVDPTDGSCWAATGGSIMHVAADGTVLSQTNGFWYPPSVSANSADGSCWVADTDNNQVVHLVADGTEVWRGGGFSGPWSVSANPADGSCWVADYGHNQVVHLAANGTEVWRGGGFNQPHSVSANPADGSCWVANTLNNQVVHLAADGTEVWRGGGFDTPSSVSASSADGSCWVADRYNNQIVHLAADGTELWRGGGYNEPWSVSVNPTDGSCWVADTYGNQVIHLAADGMEVWRGGGFCYPESVSANSADGSCWVADSGHNRVVHLAADGAEVWRGGGFYWPCSVSANPADGSCWVADTYTDQVVHLAADGMEVWRGGGFDMPYSVSASSADGSCWVADTHNYQVVHLATDGTEVWRGGGFNQPHSVSANPADGSCWVADTYNHQVVHLAADGTEVWRGGGFSHPESVSANPADGSCWVADTWNNQVVHLAADGTELWRGGGFYCPGSVSANPADGSCWVADTDNNQVVHLAADGTEVWRGGGFNYSQSVSANPADGSCWVADTNNSQVVRLATGAAPPVHDLQVSALSEPATVGSGGTTSLSAAATDSEGHGVASWSWSDNGAGGTFLPSANVQSPTWTAPGNTLGFRRWRILTVTAVCDGSPAASAHANTIVAENPSWHNVSVTAAASPGSVTSGGTTRLTGRAVDWLGHGIVSWSWTDNGAGGAFSPSADVQNPTWTAPGNATGSDQWHTLTVTATCDGSPPSSGRGSVRVVEHRPAHAVSVTASANPAEIQSGATTQLSARAADEFGHAMGFWEWTDNGAGGRFWPNAYSQNPIWRGPGNLSGSPIERRLSVIATCSEDWISFGAADVSVTEAPWTGEPTALTLEQPCPISQQTTEPATYQVVVPDGTADLFVTLQKGGSAWYSTVKLYLGEVEVADDGEWDDVIIDLPAPLPGTYLLTIEGTGTGTLTARTSLPELTLGEWTVGTIYRAWSSAWYQVSVPPGQASLFVAVETIGLRSQLRVYRGALNTTPVWSASGPSMNLAIPSPEPGIYYVHLTDSAYIESDSQARDHMIKADVVPIAPPPCSGPTITSFSPTVGGTAGPVTVTINGQCLDPGTAVCLMRPDHPDVCATSIAGSEDGRTLTATLDLSSAEPGAWDLVVTNPDAQAALAPTVFTVETGGEAKLWVEIVGREQARDGREQTYCVRYGNSGTIDAEEALLVLNVDLPADVQLTYIEEDPMPLPWDTGVTAPGNAGPMGPAAAASRWEWVADKSGQLYKVLKPLASGETRTEKFLLKPLRKAGQVAGVVNLGFDIHRDFKLWWYQVHRLVAQNPSLDGDTLQNEIDWQMKVVWQAGLLTFRIERDFWTWWWLSKFGDMLEPGWQAVMDLNDVLQALGHVLEMAPSDSSTSKGITVVSSISPEDKYGPSGYDAADTPTNQRQHWIPSDRPLDYRIDFWNREDAPAATCDVIVTDQLDPNLDWSTFQFTEVGFLDWSVPLEPCQYFSVDVNGVEIDLSTYYPGESQPALVVNVEGTFNPNTGQIEWRFHTMDQATREYPENPFAGFLPPMTDSGWEMGWVNFSVSPVAGLASGTQIANQSYVKFDVDVFKPAPPAGPYVNTLDALPPASAVLPLAAQQQWPAFTVSWQGADDTGGSGLQSYDLYVSEDGEAPYLYRGGLVTESTAFFGRPGHNYAFHTRARDNVGHLEAAPGAPDAITTAGLGFSDLPDGFWALNQIYSLMLAGIVGGYWDNTYRPGEAVTRDQMAVFVSRALAGGDSNVPPGPDTATFSDVPTSFWAFKYVEYAKAHGVVGGYWDGTYRPTLTVTRDQMAVFVARAMVGGDAFVPTGPATAYFPDVPTDYWAFKYVEYIRGEGVTGGYPDSTYRPLVAVTRDQMAVYVQRAFDLPM